MNLLLIASNQRLPGDIMVTQRSIVGYLPGRWNQAGLLVLGLTVRKA
jgi:hypothetical protein